jgi:hypothetical protein
MRQLYKLSLVLFFSLISSLILSAQTIVYPGLSTPNVFTNTNQFTSGVNVGPQLFANLSGLVGLTNLVYLSDGTAGSNPCTGGGTGAFAVYINGAWNCGFGGTSGVTSITASSPIVVSPSPLTSTGAISCPTCSTFNPPSAQVGDIMRYNVAGDSLWDASNAAVKIMGVSINASNTNNFDSWGTPTCGCGNTYSSSSGVAPTATDGWGQYIQSTSSASTTTVGVHTAENGNNTQIGILSWHRFSSKFRIWQTTNARFWIGIGTWNTNTGYAGNNNLQLDGTTAYAADIPNKNTIGFRYSAGTDIAWQAVAILAGASPSSTIVSTGISPDTNIHLFEMATNATGTAVYYFIDHTLVATITTNLPAVPSGGTQTSANYDLTGAPFWTADNEDTVHTVSATWFGVNLSLK